jgi:hypothetical protein
MSARKILSGVAMAVLSGGCLAADAASSCSPALSEVDVEDGLKVQADCGFPVRTLNRMTTELNHAKMYSFAAGSQGTTPDGNKTKNPVRP